MGFQVVEIDGANYSGDGRLRVANDPGAVPSGATAVDGGVAGAVASTGTGYVDTVYTITATKTLVVQIFYGGAAVTGNGSKVELFYDPNGNGTGMTLVRAGYVDGATFTFDLLREFGPGNGTRAMRVRRTNLGGASREIAGYFSGYERT